MTWVLLRECEAKSWDGKIMEVDEMAILSDLVESGDEIEVDKYQFI
jgi:hypothetical protein